MTQAQLSAMLESMTGHLKASDAAQEKQLQQVRKIVASSLVTQRVEDTGAEQLFYKANLYDRHLIGKDTLKNIDTISARAFGNIQPEAAVSENVFVRSVPVLNAAVAGSKPDWAAGVAPAESFGPFLNNEGREIWIDVYKIEKLVTIYLGAQPVLLFKTTLRGWRGIPSITQLLTSYKISPGSVWIHARLFSASAPAGHFVGVQVKGGALNLSIKPTLQNNNITINAATRVDVSLQLVQHEDAHAQESSSYGKDARDAKYFLPETWTFSLQGNKATITEVAPATCSMYGQDIAFNFTPAANLATSYVNGALLVPWKADTDRLTIGSNKSPWTTLSESAGIQKSFWALPTAALNVSNPVAVSGNGMVMLQCDDGLRLRWTGLQYEDIRLLKPSILGKPGDLSIIDLESNGLGASHHFELWTDTQNPHGTTADTELLQKAPLILTVNSNAAELVSTFCSATILADRPVKVDGTPFAIGSPSTNLLLSAGKNGRRVLLMEDNALPATTPGIAAPAIKLHSIALENALFTVSPVKTFILIGECDDAMVNVQRGNLITAFTLYSYLPTLPDPYVARLGFRRGNRTGSAGAAALNSLLICFITFAPSGDTDDVKVNFYFGGADLPNLWELPAAEKPVAKPIKTGRTATLKRKTAITPLTKKATVRSAIFGNLGSSVKLATEHFLPEITNAKIPDAVTALPQPEWNTPLLDGFKKNPQEIYQPEELVKMGKNLEDIWDAGVGTRDDFFSLLDVSSNANQMGVSFGAAWQIIRTGRVRGREGEEQQVNYNTAFPLMVEGMQVKMPSHRVRAFTLPLMAWEPEMNLTPPDRDDPDDPSSPKLLMDPEAGPLYYANDGGPARIWNNNTAPVPLAPIPVTNALIEDFKSQPGNYTLATFTLPFGLKAVSYISKHFVETEKPSIENIRPRFRKDPAESNTYKLEGGIQLSLQAGNFGKPAQPTKGLPADEPMFPGYTMQANNLLNWFGIASYASNLGHRVTEIFNNEFLFGALSLSPLIKDSRGVPVKRMDITGYGANMFSDWVSPSAALAQTSQARFDVLMGRTSHEIIQVKSILYPWGIRVVRTITVFRTGAAIIFRTDSGWKAESDGLFDFSYSYWKNGNLVDENDAYEIHPGIIKGLFNVRNIKDAPSVTEYISRNTIAPNQEYLNGIKGVWMTNGGTERNEPVKCGGVYFDADVEIENVVQGHVNKRVVSKKILGYVQVAPAGKPLTQEQLAELLALQGGNIGGDIDCVIDINKSGQQMRGARFDMNISVNKNGSRPVFAGAARGQVFLPKDGSWSLVQHSVGTGEVTPLQQNTMTPVIRAGIWRNGKLVDNSTLTNQLVRVAHPMEILRDPTTASINFGFLQSTATQKALFLTPAYGAGINKLLSKTPPVFADAYRLMTGESIFPNIGNAIDNFGKAMPLLNSKDGNGNIFSAFVENALQDGGEKVLELMKIEAEKVGEAVISQGMELLKQGANGVLNKALQFDVPSFEVPLVDTEALRIYIEYKAGKKGAAPKDSKLDFDVSSFANNAAEQWKSRLNNVAMVVDLGDMKRLMTIKGNFDAKKGKESNYEGGPDNDSNGLPTPELEFSDALQPVVDILQMLASLSTGDYKETLKKGLKIAMSNSGEIWQYKFEAQKEIATIRFPPTDELYNSAQTPLKLEASLSAGVYFNAALKVTTDPSQLLPTAGAFLKFNGGLQVMCYSVGVGSIYAIGAVEVKIAADTKVGPSLALKFGFGVSVVVSLPVVGNASVSFMVGVEMYADKDKVILAALMRFRGEANLLGGLVCVAITIEAKGIVVRQNNKTDCSAQVTFAIDISIFLVIDISFSKTWGEDRQVA